MSMNSNSNNSGGGNSNDLLVENRITEDESTGIQEAITIPDRDLSQTEITIIVKQIAKVCNFLGANIMKNAAASSSPHALNAHVVGAGHPVCQAIINCASQADGACMTLAAMEQPRIMQPQALPVMRPRRQ